MENGNILKLENKPLCQCPNSCNNDTPCKNETIGNTLFCEKHQNCMGSPTNGWEPEYIANKLNKLYKYIKTHNCMSYALRGNFMNLYLMKQCKTNNNCDNVNFEQPGGKSGQRDAMKKEVLRTCNTVKNLVISDLGSKNFLPTTFCKECPAGFSKVALVVDNGTDYHWYRQDSNGMWSHKDGSNPVKNFDAKKQKIFNPKQISRDYGDDLNYKSFCGFFCVNRNDTPNLGQGGKRKTQKSKRRKTIGGKRKRLNPLKSLKNLR
jgi:hypothetical protein